MSKCCDNPDRFPVGGGKQSCAVCGNMTDCGYNGPGVYTHYKGGLYIVFGLSKREYDETHHVCYMTLDQGRQQDNWYSGFFCITRPLNEEDGPDCWNSLVPSPTFPPDFVPRFKKAA